MCGVSGILFREPSTCPALTSMIEEMATRGPDDRGFLVWDGATAPQVARTQPEGSGRVHLAHMRLAVLDVAARSAQPMVYGGGRYQIVYNGEIYNYVELRDELRTLGHRFATESDTEVLIAALAEWGPKALGRMIGMFAFILLDLERRVVTVGRDPFGIKPLYWAIHSGGLAFSSEPLPLLNLPGVNAEYDDQALYDYLSFRYLDIGTRTMLRNVHRLTAGVTREIDLETLEMGPEIRFWSPQLNEERLTFEQSAEKFRELFLDSVRLHMRADIPVGVALSGGLDSSAIACAMRKLYPDQEIHAFSYIADDPALSEEKYVDALTDELNLVTHKTHLTGVDVGVNIDAMVTLQGEPFSTSSVLAQQRVFAAAKAAKIKVLLEGQGADEMLAGYPFYRGSLAASNLRRGRLVAARRMLKGQGEGVAARHLAQHLAGAVLGARDGAMGGLLARLTKRGIAPWISPAGLSETDILAGPPPVAAWSKRTLTAELIRSMEQQPLQALLRYGDRNSMSNGVENRVPFLSLRLVEHTLSLPEEHLLSPKRYSKGLLREAMRDIVPDYILDRRDKVGFVTPEASWLPVLVPRLRDAIRTAPLPAFIDRTGAESYFIDVAEGRTTFAAQAWRLANVVLWADKLNRRVGL